jgi:hypothetical protein
MCDSRERDGCVCTIEEELSDVCAGMLEEELSDVCMYDRGTE